MNITGSFAEAGGCIVLPNQAGPVQHFALDIGGSLVKIVYFVGNQEQAPTDPISAFTGGKLHFIKFMTRQIEDCIAFIRSHNLLGGKKIIKVTGGGAYKFADLFEEKLGVKLIKEDEMKAVITGTNFLLRHVPAEAFTLALDTVPEPTRDFTATKEIYPYLLVNVGSGVSVIRVDSETSFQRVDGTSLGGGTFYGLCKLLTGVEDFEEMLTLSAAGDNRSVDLVVKDIYGQDYAKVGLGADIIASTFGKVMYGKDKEQMNPRDIASSLLKMICNNTAQIAYHNAMRYNISRIYFGGFFIRNHVPTMKGISMGVNFWSGDSMKAYFLLHEGYLGALGAFLHGETMPAEQASRFSWSYLFRNMNVKNWSLDITGPERIEKMECECGCEFCEGLVCKNDKH